MSNDWKTYPQDEPNFGDNVLIIESDAYRAGVWSWDEQYRDSDGDLQPMKLGAKWLLLPPPATATPLGTTPLQETAAAATTSDDEITAEKMRNEEGWEETYNADAGYGQENDFLVSFKHGGELHVNFDRDGLGVWYEVNYANTRVGISNMSELRLLIKWLS